MSEPVSATIYATQLSTLQEGYPLWDPSPGSQPAVEIADVGYVEYGAWTRLFNASKPLGDPTNNLGVPEKYQQFHVGDVRERSCLPARVPIRSESVEQRDLGVAMGVGVPIQGGGGFDFKCSKEQGAVLLIGDDADRRDAFRKQDFARLMIRQSTKWLKFANDVQGRGILLDDLVLVTGYDRTSSWACAAFSKESSEAGVSFSIGQSGVAGGNISMSWSWKNCFSVATRSGPSRAVGTAPQYFVPTPPSTTETPPDIGDVYMTDAATNVLAIASPRNQCVFLRGYKICDRKTWGTRRLLRRKRKYDGFERVPYKRKDDPDDPDPGPSKRPTLRPDQRTTGAYNTLPARGGESSQSGTTSGSNPGGARDEEIGLSSGTSEYLDSESFKSDPSDEDLNLQMFLNQHKEPTLSALVLYYLLENSTADFAIIHDDDVVTEGLLNEAVTSTVDFECRIRALLPKIYVNDHVAMLATTYHALLPSTLVTGPGTNISDSMADQPSTGTRSSIGGARGAGAPSGDSCERVHDGSALPLTDVSPRRVLSTQTVKMMRPAYVPTKKVPQPLAAFHGQAHRPNGACDACKQSKIKCVFAPLSPKCRRCTHGGHDCHISGRKQKPRPPSHDELLARLRDKDAQIWGLLDPSSSSASASPPALPPLPVWDKRTPKADVDRLVSGWIAEARGIPREPVFNDEEPPPEILRDKIVSPQDVDLLFRIFFDKINMFFTICDPVLHTPARVLRTSPFLFTTICATASRHHPTAPYPALFAAAKRAAAHALHAPKRVETCQAYLLLGVYHPPPRSFREDRTFLWIGLAICIATDLGLHVGGQDTSAVVGGEEEERQRLNRARAWLNCFCNDKSISTQLGKPGAIGRGVGPGVDVRRWWSLSEFNTPHDIHICAYAELMGVMSDFHEVVVGERAHGGVESAENGYGSDGSGEGEKHLALPLVQSYANKIDAVSAQWTRTLAQNYAARPHPATAWRDQLWPFMVQYAKLVVVSIGLQEGMRQGLRRDNPFGDQCVEAATNILTHVTKTLAELGCLRYCVEAHFVFMGFAAAFLLKILRPKFSFMMRPGRAEHITSLVQQLIDLLGSDSIAIDSRHTPRLYARFLKTVLDRQAARLGPATVPTSLLTSYPADTDLGAYPADYAYPLHNSYITVNSTHPYAANATQNPINNPTTWDHTTHPSCLPVHNPSPDPRDTQTLARERMYNFDAAQPSYLDTQMGVDSSLNDFGAAMGEGRGEDMMLHSMAAVTDPRFWEGGTMPGFAWAADAVEGGAGGAEGANAGG